MGAAVSVSGLWWKYPGFAGQDNPFVLRGVELEVEQGEFLAITGPSGSGKTTLCCLIAGVLPHGAKLGPEPGRYFRGRVRVLGETVTELDAPPEHPEGPGRVAGRGVMAPEVGLVMQDPENQFLRMSVLHEVALGLQIMQLDPDEITRRVREALDMVDLGHLWPVAHLTHPAELSGGQKQRVAIASFLAMRPRVFILDEPTSDLDPVGKHEVVGAVQTLRRQHGLTVIMVEHNPEVISEFADRVALLDEGRILQVAEPARFYDDVDFLTAHGVAVPDVRRILHWCPSLPDAPRPPDSLPGVASLVAHRLPERIPPPSPAAVSALPPEQPSVQAALVWPPEEPAVQVADVWHRYPDGTLSLRGVNLTVGKGELIALLGANGSGKTTLSKIISGIYAPLRGEVQVLGRRIQGRRARRTLPRHVGYVFQNPEHQIFSRSVYDDVAYGLRNLELPEAEVQVRVQRALETVGLWDLAQEDPLFLGKGQKQRLAVASILAMEPPILIVDEPTTGQDFRMCQNIMELLVRLHAQGTTVIVITHDMRLVTEFCPRAVVLKEGQVGFDGAVRDLFGDEGTLAEVGLSAPQAVRLAWETRRLRPDLPSVINLEDWKRCFGEGDGCPAKS